MGNRPDRVGEAIRDELSQLIAREVHDPGIGFITLTRVSVTPDLQLARVFYTSLGDDKARQDTAKALTRAAPFLRRQIGARIRLRRVPELAFFYDESIAHTDRIEQILQELKAETDSRRGSEEATATGPDERPSTGSGRPEPVDGRSGAVAPASEPAGAAPEADGAKRPGQE